MGNNIIIILNHLTKEHIMKTNELLRVKQNLLQDKTIPLKTTNLNVLMQKDEAYTKSSLLLLTSIKENQQISSTSQSTEHCLQGCVNDRRQLAGRHNNIPANILFLATRRNRQI